VLLLSTFAIQLQDAKGLHSPWLDSTSHCSTILYSQIKQSNRNLQSNGRCPVIRFSKEQGTRRWPTCPGKPTALDGPRRDSYGWAPNRSRRGAGANRRFLWPARRSSARLRGAAPSCPRQFAAVPEPGARVLGVATASFTACSKGRDRDLRLPEPARSPCLAATMVGNSERETLSVGIFSFFSFFWHALSGDKRVEENCQASVQQLYMS
jgi:hypothetical protein